MLKQIDPINLEAGARLRATRMAKGLSQQKLAAALGLTFQQIQKYEAGANRIGIPALLRMAQALKVPAHDLLPSLDKPGSTEPVFWSSKAARAANLLTQLPPADQTRLVSALEILAAIPGDAASYQEAAE